jgi:O-antigen biosynthesis protein
VARLSGRMRYGLILRRRARVGRLRWPWPISFTLWSEDWRAPAEWLCTIERVIQHTGARVIRGGDYDQWDLEIQCGMLGRARLRMAIEEHGAGRQMVRMRCWPKSSFLGLTAIMLSGGLAMAALPTAAGGGVSLVFGAICLSLIAELVREYAGAAALAGDALSAPQPIPARYPNVDDTDWNDVRRAM